VLLLLGLAANRLALPTLAAPSRSGRPNTAEANSDLMPGAPVRSPRPMPRKLCCHPHPSQSRMCRFPASGSSWKSFAREGVAMDDSGSRQRMTLLSSRLATDSRFFPPRSGLERSDFVPWPKAEMPAASRGGGFLGWTCRAGTRPPGQPVTRS
jgi:hypothetical protein